MPVRPGRISSYLIGWAAAFATLVLVAGLTHFLAILILPSVASKDAFTLLQPADGANKMALLAPSRPGDSLIPFRDPQTVQGTCFFDIGAAPVRIRTKTETGRLLTLSFRTPQGRIFYSMTDLAALRGSIDIRLVTEDQLNTIEDQDDDDSSLPSELRLRAPTKTGLVVATALIERPSDLKEAEARIKAITCAPEPLPPPQG